MPEKNLELKLNLDALPGKFAAMRRERLLRGVRKEFEIVGEHTDVDKLVLRVEMRPVLPDEPDGEQYPAVIARTSTGLELEVDWVQNIEWKSDAGEPPKLVVTVLLKSGAKIG